MTKPTDTEAIRKGVELAYPKFEMDDDGWVYNDAVNAFPKRMHISWLWFLAALAHDLVDMVDGLAPDVVLSVGFHGEVMVYQCSTDEDWWGGEPKGSGDRRLNTIHAVVQFYEAYPELAAVREDKV